MNKLSFIIGAFALAAAGHANAQELNATVTSSSSVPVRLEVRAQGAEKREIIKTEIEARKQNLEIKKTERADARVEIRTTSRENASDRLEKIVVLSTERLSRAIERLDIIKSKIESRLAKIDAAGGSTVEVRAGIVSATAEIEAAKRSIAAISTVTISEEDPRSSLETIKTAIRKAESDVRDAHKALTDLIPSLKRSDVSATTTASVR